MDRPKIKQQLFWNSLSCFSHFPMKNAIFKCEDLMLLFGRYKSKLNVGVLSCGEDKTKDFENIRQIMWGICNSFSDILLHL